MKFFCFLAILLMIIVLSKGEGGCRDLNYLHCMINKALIGHVIKKYRVLVPGLEACQHKCFGEPHCVSYNLGPVEGHVRTCELSSTDHGTYPAKLVTKEGYEYCPTKNPCLSMPCSANELCFPDFAWNTFTCRDGDWTHWGAWFYQYCPRNTRTRSCVNPFLNVAASDCPGLAKEVKLPSQPVVDVSSCSQPLGLQDGRIQNDQIIASSIYASYCSKDFARLHRQRTSSHDGSWCAKVNQIGEYVQIDLGSIKTVTKVATQGRDIDYHDQWVTKYTLSYSNDNKNWKDYDCVKDFAANTDKTTVVTNVLPWPIKAQYIRVVVYSWSGYISMRLELYGC